MTFYSGFVSIIGKPNVGKSTLLNRLIQQKVSIVSPKPQTTRNKILGILNQDNYQIIFIDTPGIHKSNNKLDEYMDKTIKDAKNDGDITMLVVDGTKKFTADVYKLIQDTASKFKTILVVNKVDATTYEKMYPVLADLSKIDGLIDIIPVSAKTGRNVDVLLAKIKENMPEGVKYYADDEYTDKSIRFMVAEIVREKALLYLQDEIPHGIAIDVVQFKENDKLTEIDVDLICEKSGHKQIIIGKNGDMLKQIGSASRMDIEKLLNKKVFLRIFVKVRQEWRENQTYVKELGYSDN